MSSRVRLAAVVVAWGLCAPLASAQVFEVTVETGTRQTTGGDSISYDLYIPEATPSLPAPPWPGLVLNHGFARDKRYHADTARFLAERGIVVLVPNLVSLLGGEAAQLRAVADTVDNAAWLRTRGVTPGDTLFGRLDPGRVGLAGHSAGGAIALEAAWVQERSTGIPVAALVLLDAVPWPRTLQRAATLRPIFAVSLRSDPSACNAFGSGLGIVDAVSFPMDDVLVVQSTHCDPEAPSGLACAVACGPPTVRGRSLYRTLLYAFLREFLQAPALGATTTFRQTVASLEEEGQVISESYGPPLSLRLTVNGRDRAVRPSSRVRLSLDVVAGPLSSCLDWYLAARVAGKTLWLTPQGFSVKRKPAIRGQARPLPDVVLLDTTLPPGAVVTFAVSATDGAHAVAADAITVLAPGP